MDFPYYSGPWAKPSLSSFYGPKARGIPAHRQETDRGIPVGQEKKAAAPKVVQIPIHFVGSDSGPNRSTSALKIQKVFRGFLVRKSMRKIMAIKKEVDEIDAGVSRSEEVELIKKDAKERLKVNEMLMALLFKLDSVRGVDSGVRECRRTVIKKAIALQERVDAIASSSSTADGRVQVETVTMEDEENHQAEKCQAFDSQEDLTAAAGNFEDQADEVQDSAAEGNSENQVLEIQDLAGAVNLAKNDSFEDQIPENSGVVHFQNGSGRGSEERNNCTGEKVDGVAEEPTLIEEKCWEDVGGDSENCVEGVMEEDVGVVSEMKVDEEDCVEKVMLENVEKKNCTDVHADFPMMEDNGEEMCEKSECVEESVETSQMEDGIGGVEENDVGLGKGGEARKDGGDDNKRNRELLERMMEENEKLKKLMTQLNERNEVQTRMLNTLTHRVELLEKAFVCDKIKRKKKRHAS